MRTPLRQPRRLAIAALANADMMALAAGQPRLSRRKPWEGGCCVGRQRWLPFESYEQLDRLWPQLPESQRLKVVRLYGRLMARAAGCRPERTEKEEGSREHDDR